MKRSNLERKIMQRGWKVVLKSLIASYIITGGLLLFIALLLYKTEPQESMVTIGIQLIYVFSCFLGGIFAGKGMKEKRFLWGLFTGTCYYTFLVIISLCSGGISGSWQQILLTFALCAGGGMLGGIIS